MVRITDVGQVFTGMHGKFSDAASTAVDQGKTMPDTGRQVLTRQLNTGPAVLINGLAKANISGQVINNGNDKLIA